MVDETAPLLSPPRATARRIMRYTGHVLHVRDEIAQELVDQYAHACEAAGLDQLIVVSHLLVETRRPSPQLKLDVAAVLERRPKWAAFARAHTGVLAAHAVERKRETAAQRELIDEARGLLPTLEEHRGRGATIGTFARAWSPDADYATRLVGCANTILEPQY